jgi:1,4-alpha-glucan branching enzyme
MPASPKIPESVQRIADATHYDPYGVLGPHATPEGAVVRVMLPHARSVSVVVGADVIPAKRIHPHGVFEARLPALTEDYLLRVDDRELGVIEQADPYAFRVRIPDTDLYLFGEGTHYRTYDHMGAHAMSMRGTPGFAVWAPNAAASAWWATSTAGTAASTPCGCAAGGGVGAVHARPQALGDLYKFEIGRDGTIGPQVRSLSAAGELRPQDRLHRRPPTCTPTNGRTRLAGAPQPFRLAAQPHLGLRGPPGLLATRPTRRGTFLTYREMAERLAPYVKDLGFTHVELLPVTEHPFDGSWGYQTGYYAPTSRFGTPDDFMYFVDPATSTASASSSTGCPPTSPRTRTAWPASTAPTSTSTPTPAQGRAHGLGHLIFNYGRNEVRNFLLSSALFWPRSTTSTACAWTPWPACSTSTTPARPGEWVPNSSAAAKTWRPSTSSSEFNEVAHQRVAPASSPSPRNPPPGRWSPTHLPRRPRLRPQVEHGLDERHPALHRKGPIHRKYHHGELTFSLIYAFTENFILPFSHDEVVHGKGSHARQDAGRFLAEVRQPAPALRLHVHPSRQEAALHGLRVRPVDRMEQRANKASSATCARARTRATASWSPSILPPSRARTTAWACPTPATTARRSTATPRNTAAATWATPAASTATTSPGWAANTPSASPSRPSAA